MDGDHLGFMIKLAVGNRFVRTYGNPLAICSSKHKHILADLIELGSRTDMSGSISMMSVSKIVLSRLISSLPLTCILFGFSSVSAKVGAIAKESVVFSAMVVSQV